MNTPIYDYLAKYSESGFLRMHMPGHKGRSSENILSKVYPLDITEITDAGNLFENDGIISESEKNASRIFGTKATFYSVGGSTLCIQTMLALMKYDHRNVIAVRNAHRSFLSACVLLDIDVSWVYPVYEDSIISGTVLLCDIEEKLKKTSNACLYITSPDYFGSMADIKSIAELCHRYNAVLVVDNAHGACLPFYKENMHPIALGADMCCDSAHKMLPALTGAAYLHIGNPVYSSKVKEVMTMFASTSPSYLIMCSLDLCNVFLEDQIKQRLKSSEKYIACLKRSDALKRFKTEIPEFYSEPLHFTINAYESGINGLKLAAMLRKRKIEYEYADNTHIIMLFSPLDDADVYNRLENVLDSIQFQPSEVSNLKINFPAPEKYMTIREAAFSEYEEIPVEKSGGRVCAAVNIPCPPAIPIVVSGEIISDECISIMKRFGIEKIKTLKL